MLKLVLLQLLKEKVSVINIVTVFREMLFSVGIIDFTTQCLYKVTFTFHVVLIGTNFEKCNARVPMEETLCSMLCMQGIKYSFMHISTYQQYNCDINIIFFQN